MSDDRPLIGKCLCGDVRIALSNVERHVEICQCTMCRQWGGAFYSGISGAEQIDGEANATIYRSSEWAERAFCARCGSNLWFRFLPTGTRSFSAGLFDDAARFLVEKEIFSDKAAAWTRLATDHPRQTGAEIIAEAKAAGFTFD